MSLSFASAQAQSGRESTTGQLVAADSGFGFRLLKELAHEQTGANVFISPYSIASVLQMISNGARGPTQQELQQVLGTTGLSPESLNAAYADLNASLRAGQSNSVLNIANAIWYRQGAQLNNEFAAVNQQFYHAELAAVNFSAGASVREMNRWAAENTHGKIQTIIQPPIPPDTAIVLANAIYFKGTWLNPFDPRLTKERAFHLEQGGDRQVPMMTQTRTFSYQSAEGFQAVQLPYSDKRLQMEILLPQTNSTLASLLEDLEARRWQDTVLPGFRPRKGTLVLPRLKLRYGAELKNPLAVLGLKTALSSSADFSGMSPSHLFLSEVKHQSFVEVNEQGTEAAAATTGVMALASIQKPPPPFAMNVDRPFLFIISDQATKAILFMGLVFDPS